MNLNNDFKVGTQVPSFKPITFLLSDEKGANLYEKIEDVELRK